MLLISMGTQYTRRSKIEWFLPRINQAMEQGYVVDEEKLIAEFCLANNSTRKTALEILKLLELHKRIVRVDGRIWTPEAYEAEMILRRAVFNANDQKEVIGA